MSLVRKHGGLELNILGENQMFGKKKNQETDLDRREVLKKGFKLGMAATGIAAAAQFISPAAAHAGKYSYQEYIDAGFPPGIADASTRHPAIANLWNDLKQGDFSNFRRTLGFDTRNNLGSMSSKAWLEEPAFYFIGMHWHEFDGYLNDEELIKNNLAMKGFKDMMDIYIRKYSPYLQKGIPRNPYWMAKTNLEMDGIMTLMEASGIQPEKFKNLGYTMQGNYLEQLREIFKQYQTSDELQKKRTLNLITENLKSQNKTQQRIAAWTGHFLTLYFQEIEGKGKNTMRYYNLIEQPTKKIYGNPIRGPPYY